MDHPPVTLAMGLRSSPGAAEVINAAPRQRPTTQFKANYPLTTTPQQSPHRLTTRRRET